MKTEGKGWVHPGLSWVEIESTAVKEDRGLEILDVAEPTDPTLDRHDLAVHSLGDCISDSMPAVADDIRQTLFDRTRDRSSSAPALCESLACTSL